MGLKPIEMFYLKAFGVKVSLLLSFISFSQHLVSVPVVCCYITIYPETQQLKIITLVGLDQKSAAWSGLGSTQESLAGSSFQDGSLECLSSLCWPSARSSKRAVARSLGLFSKQTSLRDSLCFLTAWWMGSKKKYFKTQEIEAANSESGRTSLQTMALKFSSFAECNLFILFEAGVFPYAVGSQFSPNSQRSL